MAEKAPAFQVYTKDFDTDEKVMLMTLEQEGAYFRLLRVQWREGSIPQEHALLSVLCRVTAKRFTQSVWPGIAACFTESPEPGRLANQRMEKERAKQEAYRRERSESGQRGNTKRHGGVAERSLSDRSATAQPKSGPGSANAERSPAVCCLPFAVCDTEEQQQQQTPDPTDVGSEAQANLPRGWNGEAATDFQAAYGGSPSQQVMRQVKDVAKRFGWTRVRPVFRALLSETPLEFLNLPKVLAVRVEAASNGRDGHAGKRKVPENLTTIGEALARQDREREAENASRAADIELMPRKADGRTPDIEEFKRRLREKKLRDLDAAAAGPLEPTA